jgi:hypothetical protein
MSAYHEIFAPDRPARLGFVFYTIRAEDVGKSVIETEKGPISLSAVIVRVSKGDIGKRVYHVLNEAGDTWFWQVENDAQRDKRVSHG